MELIKSIKEFRKARRLCCKAAAEAASRSPLVGFVPTMGNLHNGHFSLMKLMNQECDVRLASIFVNPAQFGPSEDYENYPRTLEADLSKCEEAGVDLVFAPDAGEIYLPGRSTQVTVSGLVEGYCGIVRPGHFDGVALVVAKLFNLAQPDRAYFGQKDYQQFRVIERMARDLNFPLEMVMCPTVREESGLAMSSRNSYLTPSQRYAARTIFAGLKALEEAFQAGERGAEILKAWGRTQLDEQVRLEYLDIVDGQTLQPLSTAAEGDVVLVAARVGATRLIDNIILKAGGQDC